MLADQTWVLTGAAGRVATVLRERLAGEVRCLRLVDLVPVPAQYDGEEVVVADLRDPDAMRAAITEADGVVHLGGLADEASFHDLLDVNIAGTFNALEAARRAAVKRFVYASTSRVTGLYPITTRVNADMPSRPDGLYGVSKVAGEALCRMYAEKFGLSVISVRIGSAEDAPQDERQLSTWLSPGDCQAAFLAAMRTHDVRYAAFYAVSRNDRGWWDLTAGCELGFEPTDNAERHAEEIGARRLSSQPRQGGAYASPAYTLRWIEADRPQNTPAHRDGRVPENLCAKRPTTASKAANPDDLPNPRSQGASPCAGSSTPPTSAWTASSYRTKPPEGPATMRYPRNTRRRSSSSPTRPSSTGRWSPSPTG